MRGGARVAGLGVVAVVLLATMPGSAQAWGFDVHRFIADRAIALLPPPLKSFYERHRVTIVEHAIDPDLWRSAGFEEEPPRHFVDLDGLAAPPFTDIPRDYDAALAKFGQQRLTENGTLPWRVSEMYDQLSKAFTQAGAGSSPYAVDNIKFFSSVLAHYVGDAHVPFHAVLNYDGQLTNQHGIHARFETELFARYRGRLRLAPPSVAPVHRPVDFIFDELIRGFGKTEGILAADNAALGTATAYDDGYFDRFFARTQPVLTEQLSRAIAGVAATWIGAWEAAGKPRVPLTTARVVRTKRPPPAP
ncbi:MAG: hypothetical protein AB7I50_02255 [Vicinamibacterales bacterium]